MTYKNSKVEVNLEPEHARVTLGDVKGVIWGDIALRRKWELFEPGP